MKKIRCIDPAENWLAKNFLEPGEYTVFLKDPESIRAQIKRRIFNEIRELISKSNQTSPPFNPEKIGSYRRINEIIRDEKLIHREALLFPTHEGFIIKLNPRKPESRVRFSCAHEIGHTYFFDLNTSPPQKLYSVSSSRYWVEEGYACDIAREILAPEPQLSSITIKLSERPSVESLIQLRKDFNISYEPLIMRLLIDAHSYNADFWEKHLWQAIIITAEMPINKQIENLKIKVVRSTSYKYRLKNIRKNEKIVEMLSLIIEENLPKYERSIKIGRNNYLAQGALVRTWPKMAILIVSEDNKEIGK
jgi:Zn-dependent peptidase ImmA (M78 family)